MPFALIVWSQTHITSGLATILNATTPLFTLIIIHLATDTEKLNLRKASGILIGFAGVVVIIGVPNAPDALNTASPGINAALSLLAGS